jgi:hypothetical protein
VRNTIIEEYHGKGKIDDDEMKAFNKEVVNKIYTFLRFYFSTMPQDETDQFMKMVSMFLPQWDRPVLDAEMIEALILLWGEQK